MEGAHISSHNFRADFSGNMGQSCLHYPLSHSPSSLLSGISDKIHHDLYVSGHMLLCNEHKMVVHISLLLSCRQTKPREEKSAQQRLQRLQAADGQPAARNINHSQSQCLIPVAQNPEKPVWLLPREKSQVQVVGGGSPRKIHCHPDLCNPSQVTALDRKSFCFSTTYS